MCRKDVLGTALEPPNLGLSNAHLVTYVGLTAHDIFGIELTPPPIYHFWKPILYLPTFYKTSIKKVQNLYTTLRR